MLSCSYSMLGVVLMIISKTKKLTFHEMIAATGSLKSLSHCICFARLIAARCYQAKYDSTEDPVRRRSVQIALAFRFVTRPAHSVGGYLWEGSARASRSASLGNVSISSLGRVGRLSSTRLGGLSASWVGQPSRPCRLCVFRACSGSRCSESGSQKGLMNIRGCKSTLPPHPSEPGGLERKEIGAALSSTPWARGSYASDDRA